MGPGGFRVLHSPEGSRRRQHINTPQKLLVGLTGQRASSFKPQASPAGSWACIGVKVLVTHTEYSNAALTVGRCTQPLPQDCLRDFHIPRMNPRETGTFGLDGRLTGAPPAWAFRTGGPPRLLQKPSSREAYMSVSLEGLESLENSSGASM